MYSLLWKNDCINISKILMVQTFSTLITYIAIVEIKKKSCVISKLRFVSQ